VFSCEETTGYKAGPEVLKSTNKTSVWLGSVENTPTFWSEDGDEGGEMAFWWSSSATSGSMYMLRNVRMGERSRVECPTKSSSGEEEKSQTSASTPVQPWRRASYRGMRRQ
jgi:hypothetical protein